MSTRPAEILGLNKGRIKKGYEADFVLIDLDQSYIYREDEIRSKSKNSLMIDKPRYFCKRACPQDHMIHSRLFEVYI